MHKGDERGDDDGQTWQYEGGQLVGERFAAAGGHQHEGIPPGEYVFDDLELTGAKGIVAEVLFENVFDVEQSLRGPS